MHAPALRRLVVALTLLCCLSLVTSVAAGPAVNDRSVVAESATDPTANAQSNPCAGTITEPADGLTVISVQGYKFGENGGKRPAKLVGVGPAGEIRWVHQMAEEYDVRWGYDVDPMANGNLFVTATTASGGQERTLVYEFDPGTQETVWSHTFDLDDTHDADLIDDGEAILLANMRNYNESTGENEDRIFVYNRTTEEIEWEWHFDDHYDPDALEENYTDDWTHVNDVDEIGDGLYLASPRNFDQAIVVNRSTNEIEMKLGADGQKDVLDEQHNPDYLESENGTPTLLVGDSENDRIAEYELSGDPTDGTDGWTRTWTLEGDLSWPRDADRLPDGDTLVTDSANNRVAEVTPEGEVVWEFYAPWLVYDAARIPAGEHGGPTATDLNAAGTHDVEGSTGLHDNQTALRNCHEVLENVSGWAEGQTPTTEGRSADDGTTEGALGDENTGDDGQQSDSSDDGNAATDADSSTGVPGFGPVAAIAGLAFGFGLAARRIPQPPR